MTNDVEPLLFTFDSIFEETINAFQNEDKVVSLEVTKRLVVDNGLDKFLDYCNDNNIEFEIDDFGESIRLYVFRD
ncbi:hypothetical protein [Acinetobacter oleivorans]|uniref:hypothetical protein n=1 Tax=Acinetobacter oleivorans TaxID=1148157 RepID=UPI0012316582|nr:hypothetical protein [Acinetobacter oleivorans]